MQIVFHKVRKVFILSTRQGRIGEVGAVQKTPFSTFEECVKKFEIIFKNESGNEWKDRENFVKVKEKYELIELNNQDIKDKNILHKFDFKKMKVRSDLPKPLRRLFKLLTDITIYENCADAFHFDIEQIPIEKLKKEKLMEAQNTLDEIEFFIAKLKKEREKCINNADKDAIFYIHTTLFELSNAFYEIIPNSLYIGRQPPVLTNINNVTNCKREIDNLLNIELAGKILVGAAAMDDDTNPLNYTYSSLECIIHALKKYDPEYEMLKKWIENTSVKQHKIHDIFKLCRYSEYNSSEKFKHLDNRTLLFHGSGLHNFIGMIALGMRMAHPNEFISETSFGKGIYFTDTFEKASNDSSNWLGSYMVDTRLNKSNDSDSKLVLVCEVAFGKILEVDQPNDYTNKLGDCNSLRYLGQKGPSLDSKLKLDSGAEILYGTIQRNFNGNYPGEAQLEFNEYVIFNETQLRMRYLIKYS